MVQSRERQTTTPLEAMENTALEIDWFLHEPKGLGKPDFNKDQRVGIVRAAIRKLFQSFPEMKGSVAYLEWYENPTAQTAEPTEVTWVSLRQKQKYIEKIENSTCYFYDDTSAQLRWLIDYPAEHVTCFLVYVL